MRPLPSPSPSRRQSPRTRRPYLQHAFDPRAGAVARIVNQARAAAILSAAHGLLGPSDSIPRADERSFGEHRWSGHVATGAGAHLSPFFLARATRLVGCDAHEQRSRPWHIGPVFAWTDRFLLAVFACAHSAGCELRL